VARFRDDHGGLPERLARFVLSEWPGDVSEATHAWGAACRAWLTANPGRVLPHSVDILEVRQETIRLRAELLRAAREDEDGSWHD
jgi:hypothetical protein